MKFNDTFDHLMSLYVEAKEAPKGKHYDSAGRLQSGDADSDGRGGPKYRSDPTYENPNENEEGKKKKGLTGLALLAQQEQGEKVGKDGKGLGPDSKEEDNEIAKTADKVIKGTAKLAGKGALAVADFVTDGDASKAIDTVKDAYSDEEHEDCESCGCSDEEVEDCETCGCEENPKYGHFNDTYSSYIDQYEAEDAERVDKDRMR